MEKDGTLHVYLSLSWGHSNLGLVLFLCTDYTCLSFLLYLQIGVDKSDLNKVFIQLTLEIKTKQVQLLYRKESFFCYVLSFSTCLFYCLNMRMTWMLTKENSSWFSFFKYAAILILVRLFRAIAEPFMIGDCNFRSFTVLWPTTL